MERSNEFASPKKETLEKAIKEYPKYEQNYIDLITLYLSFNQEEKAFEVAKELEKEIPSSEWAQVSLMKFYLNANDGTKASQSMFKVLQSDKIDLKIKHRVFNEFLIFAVNNPIYFKEVDAAIPYFDSDPSLSVASEVAKFFWKKKDLDKAAYYFEKAIQQKSDAVESIMAILEFYPLLYRTEVIAQVEGVACGLDSGEDALLTHRHILARVTDFARLISDLRACLP